MAKTRVNVSNIGNDKKCDKRIGVLDQRTQVVKTSDGQELPLSIYEDMGNVNFFETRNKGKIVQEKGRYKMKKV